MIVYTLTLCITTRSELLLCVEIFTWHILLRQKIRQRMDSDGHVFKNLEYTFGADRIAHILRIPNKPRQLSKKITKLKTPYTHRV